MSDCLVFGSASGTQAASDASRRKYCDQIDAAQLDACESKLDGWRCGRGPEPREVLDDLSELAFKHLNAVRCADGLNRVLDRVAQLRSGELPTMSVPAGPDAPLRLREAIEAEGQARLCELMARAALERRESRGGFFGGHYRIEFPHRDDERWLKNIVLSNNGGDIVISHDEPVQIGGWSDEIRDVVATNWRPPNDPAHFAESE